MAAEFHYINLLKEIRKEVNTYNSGDSLDEGYLKKSHSLLTGFFKNKLNDKFLFSNLTFLGDNKRLVDPDNYSFSEVKRGTVDYTYINSILQKLLELIRDGKAMSFTETILKRIDRNVTLYSGERPLSLDEPYNESSAFGFDLNNLKLEKDADSFFKANEDYFKNFLEITGLKQTSAKQVSNLFFHYKLISTYLTQHGETFYMHFIRPASFNAGFFGLLSLATFKKLTEEEYVFIYLTLYRILSETTREKIILLERDKKLTEAIYGLGHLIKNRVTPTDKELKSLKNRLPKINESDERKIAEQTLENCRVDISKLRNIGHLLDVLARTTRIKDATVYTTKSDWYSNVPGGIDLNAIFNASMEFTEGGKRANINFQVPIENLKVQGFILLKDKFVTPNKFVYEETIYEIILNGLKFGENSGDNKVQFNIGRDEQKKFYFISNAVNDKGCEILKEKIDRKIIKASEWIDIDGKISGGGIFYLGLIFNHTKIGTIEAKIEEVGKRYNFLIGFNFNGLK